MNIQNDFFKILHIEPVPTGCLAEDTHLSVLRVKPAGYQSISFEKIFNFQDLAIIRNEYNYNKVIKIMEELYSAALVSPILFIGEMKNNFLIIVDKRFVNHVGDHQFKSYKSQVRKLTTDLDPSWASHIGVFSEGPDQTSDALLIEYVFKWSLGYLKEINDRWALGLSALN